MRLAATKTYNEILHKELAATIAENKSNLEAKRYGKPGTGKVGFSDKEVREAVLAAVRTMLPAATNKSIAAAQTPTMPALAKPAASTVDAITGALQTAFTRAAGTVTLVVVGESHQARDAEDAEDQTRAKALLDKMVEHSPLAATTLVVLERDLELRYKPYPSSFAPQSAMEVALTEDYDTTLQQGLSKLQRSTVIAGYVLLCLAGGDQNTVDTVVLFLGELHADALTEFEYFAKGATGASGIDWVAKRPRMLLSFSSIS
jgi:hypothetical protein